MLKRLSIWAFDQIVDTLSGDNIVNNIVSKVNAKLKFLYRHKTCLDLNSRKLLSSALLQCHFDYCCSSWFHSLNKAQTKKIQIMQNKIIRFIKDYEPRTSITNDDFVQLKMLNVENRVKQLNKVICIKFIMENVLHISARTLKNHQDLVKVIS